MLKGHLDLLLLAAVRTRPALPQAVRNWVAGVAPLAVAAAVFAWTDHDSRSVSDTLNRAVPTLCLIVAVTARVALRARGHATLWT